MIRLCIGIISVWVYIGTSNISEYNKCIQHHTKVQCVEVYK